MATDKLTLIAELKDRLTGPAKKAAHAVDDLAKSTEEAARKSERAARDSESADKRRTRSAEQTSRRVIDANGKQAKASTDNANTAQRSAALYEEAQGKLRNAQGRFASDSEKAAHRTQQALRKGLDTTRPVEQFRRGLDKAVGYADRAASKINSGLAKAGKWGAVGAGAVVGMSLAGGMSRIAGLQNTDVVLETMKFSEADRAELMKQFQEQALGTRYSTPDVAALGSSLLSSGLDRSKLDTALSGAVDAASVYNLDLNEIAIPLQQIQTKGRLQAEEMMQLQERRMDIAGWLAESKGVDRAKISDMVSDGQISPDDVFEAIAKATEGGAERAGATISGAWANFKNAFSMGGAEFLKPIVGPLTDGMVQLKDLLASPEAAGFLADLGSRLAPGIEEAFGSLPALVQALEPLGPTVKNLFSAAGSALPGLVQGFTAWLNIIIPIVQPFAELTSLIVRGLGPAMPVIVPLVFGFAAAMTALRVAGSVAGGIKAFAGGTQVLLRMLAGKQGATLLTEAFGDRVVHTKDRVQSLAGQGGLGRLNDRLGATNKVMGRGERAARGLGKGLGIAAAAAGALVGASKGMEALNGISAGSTEEQLANTMMTGGDPNKAFREADWANHQGSILGGTMSGVDGVGDVINKQQNMGVGDKIMGGIKTGASGILSGLTFGAIPQYKDGWDKAFDQLSAQDSALAGAVGTPEAGATFGQIMADARRAGATDEDVLKALPQYKNAVIARLTEKKIPADDSTALQYMGSTNGFRSGGYTGDGSPDAPAGVVHKKEYVFNAARTAQIGVDNLRAIHAGRAPAGESFTFAPTVHVTGTPGTDLSAIRSTVQGVLREEARKVRNTHGTRAKRGAH